MRHQNLLLIKWSMKWGSLTHPGTQPASPVHPLLFNIHLTCLMSPWIWPSSSLKPYSLAKSDVNIIRAVLECLLGSAARPATALPANSTVSASSNSAADAPPGTHYLWIVWYLYGIALKWLINIIKTYFLPPFQSWQVLATRKSW